MGAVGEAMQEFEALQRWDSLLLCLRLLDKQAQSLDLVQRRLQVLLSSKVLIAVSCQQCLSIRDGLETKGFDRLASEEHICPAAKSSCCMQELGCWVAELPALCLAGGA